MELGIWIVELACLIHPDTDNLDSSARNLVLFKHSVRQRSEILFQLWPKLFVKRIVDARAISHWGSPRIAAAARRLLLQCLFAPAVVVSRSTIDAVRWVVDADAYRGRVVVPSGSRNLLEDVRGVQRTDPPATCAHSGDRSDQQLRGYIAPGSNRQSSVAPGRRRHLHYRS